MTVVVHDYLTQRGGAERVVLELAAAFPGSRVLTSTYLADRTYPAFRGLDVRTLGLDRIPVARAEPRYALPILSDLFRRHVVDEQDLVVCSSSGFAHLVSTTVPKIVYCHNPPRWLYQPEDYLADAGRAVRASLRLLGPRLRRLDLAGAGSAAGYVANSRNVAERIKRVYGIDAVIVHPPRGLEPDGPEEAVPGVEPGYLLTVGRARGYKRTGLLIEAVAGMPGQRLVAVGSASGQVWPSNITELSGLSDAQLRWLYRNAAALVACSREDFGLTPVEAFGFGTPVGTTAQGGYLETCVDGLTGTWLDDRSPETLRRSLRSLLVQEWDRTAIVEHGSQWSPTAFRTRIAEVARSLMTTEARRAFATAPRV